MGLEEGRSEVEGISSLLLYLGILVIALECPA